MEKKKLNQENMEDVSGGIHAFDPKVDCPDSEDCLIVIRCPFCKRSVDVTYSANKPDVKVCPDCGTALPV